jgi:hypothetical protein
MASADAPLSWVRANSMAVWAAPDARPSSASMRLSSPVAALMAVSASSAGTASPVMGYLARLSATNSITSAAGGCSPNRWTAANVRARHGLCSFHSSDSHGSHPAPQGTGTVCERAVTARRVHARALRGTAQGCRAGQAEPRTRSG